MAIHNVEIAAKFNRLADLLEIEGANPFRIRAYRNAARIISSLSKNIADMIKNDEDLTELPGIGKDLAEKITVIVKTGVFPLLTQTEKRLPPLLSELMRIEGLGPKRVQVLYKKLKIRDLKDLQKALEQGRVRKLPRFGEKTEQKILEGLKRIHSYGQRVKLADIFPIEQALIRYLQLAPNIQKVECAGSFRRRKETVGDLDIVAAAKSGEKIIDHFTRYDEIAEVISHGKTRATVRLQSGTQIDLRVVPEKSYGAALIYFTGSKDHNIALRKIALHKKLKLNEYGLFRGNKEIVGRSEEEVYRQLGLSYIEPELREDHGEIKEAIANRLPRLIALQDIRGDLHCHTKATDGNASIEVMANHAASLGYEYLAITDHSQHLSMTHGFNKKTLLKQIKEIDKLNAKLSNITILKSIEVDILQDGSLDLPNDILKELDLTVCSIHSHFGLSAKKQTERILHAMDNPYFTILGHPTGRLINQRKAYEVDVERILLGAKERKIILELNAQPDRLDLSDQHCKLAKELGVKIAISTDAHSIHHFAFMQFGVYQARRGSLSKDDVINTYPMAALRKLLKR